MKSLVLAAFVAVIFACNKKANDVAPAPTEITKDTTVVVDSHNSQNSLDYIGIYKGVLPCADCEGIETLLQLSEDFTYTLTNKYLGKDVKTYEQKGTFMWNDEGDGIILDTSKDKSQRYFVGENKLIQLDATGQKVTGVLADKYILSKLPESQAVKTDAPSKMKEVIFLGTRWRLAQLGGNVIPKNNEREYALEFRTKDEFSAYAGCNSIGGKFRVKDNKIKFTNVFSTKMFCENGKTEEVFVKALEQSDNYVRNAKMLQLRAGGSVLAQFDPINKTK